VGDYAGAKLGEEKDVSSRKKTGDSKPREREIGENGTMLSQEGKHNHESARKKVQEKNRG